MSLIKHIKEIYLKINMEIDRFVLDIANMFDSNMDHSIEHIMWIEFYRKHKALKEEYKTKLNTVRNNNLVLEQLISSRRNKTIDATGIQKKIDYYAISYPEIVCGKRDCNYDAMLKFQLDPRPSLKKKRCVFDKTNKFTFISPTSISDEDLIFSSSKCFPNAISKPGDESELESEFIIL